VNGTGSRVSRALLLAGTILTALFLSVVTASLFRLPQVPAVLALGVIGIAVYAAIRPHSALVLVAAALPISTYVLGRWAYGVAWPEAVVIAFAAGCAWRGVLRRADPRLPKSLHLPVFVFACVLLSSLVVQMMVDQSRLGSAAFTTSILRHVSREYFANGAGRYLQAGELLLEGLFLFSVSARAVAADGRLARRLGGALAAATALAAAINLQQIVKSAQRFPDFWYVLEQSLLGARFNVHYADVNAAGSAFALLFLVAAGVATARGRLSGLWTGAAMLLALGLWMSGSRTALLACPVALAALGLVGARTHMSRRGRTLVAVGAVALLCGAVAVVYAPTRGNQKASSIAARVRVEMARTTMRMVAQDPLFGIGLGEFYQRSGEFSSPELLVLFPPAQHENAHNNFLQILAETGLSGLAAFVVLLSTALYRASRPLSLRPADALAWGCMAGLGAFLLTCAGGHPLLTREAAYSFWIVLGLAVGHSLHASPTPNEGQSRRVTATATIFVVCLAASVPFRVASATARGEFEHLAIGVSPLWQTAPDGVRYRSAVAGASIFVPGETGYRFRVRALSKTPERLELRLGGRVADIVELAPDRWNEIAMRPRNDRADTKFKKLDLRILSDDPRPVTIWITKVEPLER
jgi:O-antigen ligase